MAILKCIMLAGMVYMGIEEDSARSSSKVYAMSAYNDFEVKADDIKTLHAKRSDGTGQRWDVPRRWAGLPVEAILGSCIAEAEERYKTGKISYIRYEDPNGTKRKK